MCDAFRLGENGCEIVVVARLNAFNLSCVNIFFILQEHRVVDGTKRLVVEHLSAFHHEIFSAHLDVFVAGLELFHGYDGLAALLHGKEVYHCRGLVFVVVECLHGDLREEGECSFRAYDGVSDDVEWVVVDNERADVEACNVLDAVFELYSLRQFLVRPDAVSELFYLLDKVGMSLPELLFALFVASVEDGAVGENQPCTDHHAVAVGMYATVHARGIVADDAANHGAADGGRVGTEHPSVGL